MNSNLLGGLVIGAFVILGIVALVVYGPGGTTPPMATSTPVTTTTTPTPPVTPKANVPAVTTSILVIVSNSTAVVTGKVIPNGAQTSYWYDYGRTNALGTRTGTQAIGSGYVSIAAPAIINGLSPNTLYYYRLSATNAYGTSVGQTYSFTTNTTSPPAGSAPTTRTDAASSVARMSASLNGHVTPNNADTSLWFEYGETTDLGNTTAFQSGGNGTSATVVSVSLSNLKPLTKYYFRLNAQNQYGTINGATLNFTTKGPAATEVPTADTTAATSVATSTVTMNGRLNPNGDQTTYWFEYSDDSLLSILLGSTTHTQIAGNGTDTVSVSAEVKSLDSNAKYYYRLVAANSHGTVRGDIVTFTTKKQ